MEKRTFPAKIDVFPEVSEFVESTLENADSSMKATVQILIALEEIFVNIAHYAYGDGEGDAVIGISTNEGICTLTFEDCGTPFDPLAKSDPDLSAEAQEEVIGGLGIYMVKKSMDSVEYAYRDGKNTLTITKRISED